VRDQGAIVARKQIAVMVGVTHQLVSKPLERGKVAFPTSVWPTFSQVAVLERM
jgi:hypothetical protein